MGPPKKEKTPEDTPVVKQASCIFKSPPKPKYLVVMMGTNGAGKTSLVERFNKGTFTPNTSPSDRTEITNVTDFLVTTDSWNADTVLVDLEIHALQPGGANWSKDRDQAIKQADGIMLMFNASDRRSFQELEKYKIAITEMRDAEHLGVTLAGNLMNIAEDEVQVTMGESINWGRAWGPIWGMEYCQVNAADGYNVRQPFINLISEVRRKMYMSDMKEATAAICTAVQRPQEVKKEKRRWFGRRKTKVAA